MWDVCSDQEAVDLIRNVQDAQHASKVLVDHALTRFSTDNLSCMVIRLDSNRVKDVVNNKVARIGVDGDTYTKAGGLSEADKIVENVRQSMTTTDLDQDPKATEQAGKETLEKMASKGSGTQMSVDEPSESPSSDILGSAGTPQETH